MFPGSWFAVALYCCAYAAAELFRAWTKSDPIVLSEMPVAGCIKAHPYVKTCYRSDH